jgi:hypothetical protein
MIVDEHCPVHDKTSTVRSNRKARRTMSKYAIPDALVRTAWVAERLNDRKVKVASSRAGSCRRPSSRGGGRLSRRCTIESAFAT